MSPRLDANLGAGTIMKLGSLAVGRTRAWRPKARRAGSSTTTTDLTGPNKKETEHYEKDE